MKIGIVVLGYGDGEPLRAELEQWATTTDEDSPDESKLCIYYVKSGQPVPLDGEIIEWILRHSGGPTWVFQTVAFANDELAAKVAYEATVDIIRRLGLSANAWIVGASGKEKVRRVVRELCSEGVLIHPPTMH